MKQRFTKRTRLVSALLTLAMVFTFLPFSAFAAGELTDGYGPIQLDEYIPDEAFREYLKKFDENNDGTLAPEERYKVTEISVPNRNISNLDGIQFFPNLKTLKCYGNNLTSLDVSKNTVLDTLYCYNNQLTELDVSQNTALQWLSCYNNQLTSLDVSKNTVLENLWCSQNKLTELDVSQNSALQTLSCYDNQLTSLQADNCTNLTELNCGNNVYNVEVNEKTHVLDPGILPGHFDITRARNWNGADQNADGTLTVQAGGGQVTYEYLCHGSTYKTFTLNVTWTNDATPSDGIALNAENFPDEAFREYLKKFDENNDDTLEPAERYKVTKINVPNRNISNLYGIQFFPNLKELKCYGNNLTSLDVSKNTVLDTLYCYNNQLTELDVSQNTALQWLSCYNNQLTELDVSKNTLLEYLWCSQNNLTSLDVTQNTALKELSCYDNQLTSLDLSRTAVTTLNASGNKIDINVEETPRTFDLSKLPRFEVSKVSKWVGGTVSGNTLKVNAGTNQVTYTYDCGKGLSETFTLNVKVVPDGSTGGTTIPPEAGKYQLTVTDGVATVNGSTGTVLNVKPGDTVTLTADTTKFPENEEFGWWEITPYGSVSNTLTGQYQRTATFKMPNENVSARAMSKSAGVSTGGDDGGGGGAAILLVGGAAVAGLVGYGVYSYVSEQQLKALLPEGVAMPENRAQTALLLWNTAGRPEPAEAPAFKDVADPDTAKAAQWCVEHGLMDQKLGGRFAPDNSDPAYKTLNAYQQLVG